MLHTVEYACLKIIRLRNARSSLKTRKLSLVSESQTLIRWWNAYTLEQPISLKGLAPQKPSLPWQLVLRDRATHSWWRKFGGATNCSKELNSLSARFYRAPPEFHCPTHLRRQKGRNCWWQRQKLQLELYRMDRLPSSVRLLNHCRYPLKKFASCSRNARE